MLKIGLLPLYTILRPSSRYRAYQFINPLGNQGIKCQVVEAPERNFGKRLRYLPQLFRLARTQDVLFVQKRTFPAWVLKPLIKINSHLVFDFDDAIFLDPGQQAAVISILRVAKVVVAGNDYLADFARQYNSQVEIIPSVIDTDLYYPPTGPRHPGDNRLILGWIGSDPNFGSLEMLIPVLNRLYDRYQDRVILRVISGKPWRVEMKMRHEAIQWTHHQSRVDLQQFDIGLMPLEDTEWNRGKCGFKLIQYMAVGIPGVASPVGVNRTIVQDGKSGYLTTTISEWGDRLVELIERPELRYQMGRSARSEVEGSFSVKSVLPHLIHVLRQGASNGL